MTPFKDRGLPKALLWDNDGVLVNTEPIHFQATQLVFVEAGAELSESQYVADCLIAGRSIWHLLAERGVSQSDIRLLRNRRDAIYEERLREENLLVDGVVDVLETLHTKYRMAVVSGSRRRHLEMIHRLTGLQKYFDFAVTSDDCVNLKPDPEPYIRALDRLGLSPLTCLAIEDSQRGIASAVAAGIRCVVVPSRLTSGGSFAGASHILGAISELPAFLGKHA